MQVLQTCFEGREVKFRHPNWLVRVRKDPWVRVRKWKLSQWLPLPHTMTGQLKSGAKGNLWADAHRHNSLFPCCPQLVFCLIVYIIMQCWISHLKLLSMQLNKCTITFFLPAWYYIQFCKDGSVNIKLLTNCFCCAYRWRWWAIWKKWLRLEILTVQTRIQK